MAREATETFSVLRRFSAYSSTLPPDEYVADFLHLIKPCRLLTVGAQWVQNSSRSADTGALAIAEIVQWAEAADARRSDLDALAAYALAKTGCISRPEARAAGERVVALLIAHTRAQRLAASVMQCDDAASLARQAAALVVGWPESSAVTATAITPQAGPRPPKRGFFAVPPMSSDCAALDTAFNALDSSPVAIAEAFALTIALLRPETSPPSGFRQKRGLPPLVRLKALGYDERAKAGFTAELSVDRWASRSANTHVIRNPDSLFVITDQSFDSAVMLAARLAETADTSSRRSGLILQWSLQRKSLSPGDIFFASGGSIAGAFAVAFRLALHPIAHFRLPINCAVVCGLTEDAALAGVDEATIAAKLNASGTERIVLAADQKMDAGLTERCQSRIRRGMTVLAAVRQCLRILYVALLKKYYLPTAVAVAAVIFMQGIIASFWEFHMGKNFDAWSQFSTSQNPAPWSVWRYGQIKGDAEPDPHTFKIYPMVKHGDIGSVAAGLTGWTPGRFDKPNITYNSLNKDVSLTGAAVLWSKRTLSLSPGFFNSYSCLRFVAPRAGDYHTAIGYWGASTADYEAIVFLAENNRIIYRHSSHFASSATRRGQATTYDHQTHLQKGQPIDLIVGWGKGGGEGISGSSTGVTCEVTRL